MTEFDFLAFREAAIPAGYKPTDDEESKDNLDCLNEKQPIQFTAIRTHDVDELNPPEPKRVFCEGYMYS